LTRFHDFAKRVRYWRWQSYLVPWLVISGHHMLMLLQSLFGRGPIKKNLGRAVVETLAVYVIFFLPLAFFDAWTCLLGLYLPLFLGHLICNCYILSNHYDNHLNTVNCPLENSTSVYLIPGLAWTHMGFGRHVEHHIYPHVTHSKLPQVRRLLIETYPDDYQERNLLSVLHKIYSNRSQYDEVQDTGQS
jgi:fatty acid desaturase